MKAAGLTVAELTAYLTERYRQLRGHPIMVAVDVRPAASMAYLIGSIVRQGPISVKEHHTLLQAIAAAGGPRSDADLASVFVLRGSDRIPVDLRPAGVETSDPPNFMLRGGDTVAIPRRAACVPAANCVSVYGAVRSPGFVPYTSGMTVASAIAAADGLTTYASGRVAVGRGSLFHVPLEGARPRGPVRSTSIMLDPGTQAIRTDATEYAIDRTFDELLHVSDTYPLRPGDVVSVYFRLF